MKRTLFLLCLTLSGSTFGSSLEASLPWYQRLMAAVSTSVCDFVARYRLGTRTTLAVGAVTAGAVAVESLAKVGEHVQGVIRPNEKHRMQLTDNTGATNLVLETNSRLTRGEHAKKLVQHAAACALCVYSAIHLGKLAIA